MKSQKSASDRRRWERLPLAIPVFVRGLDPHGKQFIEFATALDISVGGALLAIQRHLPKGSRIMLELPSTPGPLVKVPRHAKQSVSAKLVRVTNGDQCQLFGLKFQTPLLSRPVLKKPRRIGKMPSTL
jgi:PilZ domain